MTTRLTYAVILVITLNACSRSQAPLTVHDIPLSPDEIAIIQTLSPPPPPSKKPTNQFADSPEAASLGQYLFFEAGLSHNGEISCATCHKPELDWTDGRPVAKGLRMTTRNTPSLLNLANNRWFYWDGRKDSLWSQSLSPIENDKEMGGSRLRVFRTISASAEMKRFYSAVFGPLPTIDVPKEINDAKPLENPPENRHHQNWQTLSDDQRKSLNRVFANAGKAIAAFERKLISQDSSFDRFVAAINANEREKLADYSAPALRGLKLFIGKAQCTLCHSGPNFSDMEFHNIGLNRGQGDLDLGRHLGIPAVLSDPFNGKGDFSDDTSITANTPLHYVGQKSNNIGEFKTPGLRNVAKTAPYMHDGRFENLRSVVDFYSTLPQQPAVGHREESLVQLNLNDQQKSDLVAFLESLTGQPLPARLLKKPGVQR